MITIEKVSKIYKKKKYALKDLSLEVLKGEVFGFIGPNGAGKSTTIHILMGFIKASSGKVLINDLPCGNKNTNSLIGFMPENPILYESLTAEEILFYCGRLSNMDNANIKSRSALLLDRLNLLEAKKQKISSFSKGMKQRLGLCLALIHNPPILILDEPMSGLDPLGRSLLQNIILEEKKFGKTILFCSHILNDVENLCDRIGVINRGNLLFNGETRDFIHNGLSLEKTFVKIIESHSKDLE
jgi:ABC-2 type transport system ATP-binding protein